MPRPSCLVIDNAAISHNLKKIREIAPRSKVLAMVKANAYGHGIKTVLPAVAQADGLGVAIVDEALQLRQLGYEGRIVVFDGFFSETELQQIAENNFEVVVHHPLQLSLLAEKKIEFENRLGLWLKFNTGMHRLGFPASDARSVWQQLQDLKVCRELPVLMAHFANADLLNDPMTLQQMQIFQDIVKDLPGPRSLANSAGILGWPDSHEDWIRPGLIMYGGSPFSDRDGEDLGLQPAMTFRSEIMAINHCRSGHKIGYGATWEATRDMVYGVVPIGYGDGYPQTAPSGTPVLLNGVLTPLIGRVSMDMLTIDLTERPTAKIGDEVILWGKGLSIDRISRFVQRSNYELLCQTTERVRSAPVYFLRC